MPRTNAVPKLRATLSSSPSQQLLAGNGGHSTLHDLELSHACFIAMGWLAEI